MTLRAQAVPPRGNGRDMQGLLYVAHDVIQLAALPEENRARMEHSRA
ncbi:hypothetical protein [Hyalangium minutum]|uniref:Uncharacterized protein n=1 Tax=Hyalangium minutum TaxID=394096 RepID=A0A085WTS8_9BACT|nr:hypothetical protein [Hyalangium minutum]KFE71091.1 hypothetical protein DB31_3221 [Hyalangium minutum]